MSDKVIPINQSAVVADMKEASEMSAQMVLTLERMLEMARVGELTGMIGIMQMKDGSIGNVAAGGANCHPYMTLGALEALTEHHKLAIMSIVQLKPAFGGPDHAPKQS